MEHFRIAYIMLPRLRAMPGKSALSVVCTLFIATPIFPNLSDVPLKNFLQSEQASLTLYHGTGFILLRIRHTCGRRKGENGVTLTIGQLAQAAEVHVETIRYYERRGLMPEPPRRLSGYREYDQESISRMRFIKNAQALGFSLDEIEKLLALRVDAETSCDDVRQQAEAKLGEIYEKIQALHRLQSALSELIAACERGGPQGDCPLLEALEHQAEHSKEQTYGNV